MNATNHTTCPVFPGLCTETEPGHYDHSNHDHAVTSKGGHHILDVGFVQVSDGGPAVIYLAGMDHEDLLPEEVHVKTREIRALLDEADRMADQLLGQARRCPAAHGDDPTPCSGPPTVTVLDARNRGADGCQHHAARLLASLDGGRVVSGQHHPGAAIRVYKAAASIRPFPWLEDAPRSVPSQLSHTDNHRGGETR